jgi:hypothetical protein
LINADPLAEAKMFQEFYGVVYIGTCSVNGKQYVGQTTAKDPLNYIQGHFDSARRGGQKLLYKAGARRFVLENPDIILRRNSSIKEALNKPGMNNKLSEIQKVNQSKPEVNAKVRAGVRRAVALPSYKKNHRIGILAALAVPGMLESRNAAIKLALARPEAKDRQRVAAKLRNADPEVRRKTKEAQDLPETKGKMVAGAILGCHNRWHVRRGLTNPDCPLCTPKEE